MKIALKPPVVISSGCCGYGIELKNIINLKKFGAITTKTLTYKPREGNIQPRILEIAEGSLINSIGLDNIGIERFINEILPQLEKDQIEVICSIGGEEYKDYLKSIDLLRGSKIKFIEINISCPNLPSYPLFKKEDLSPFFKDLREYWQKYIIIKLPPFVFENIQIVELALKNNIENFSVSNTQPALGLIKINGRIIPIEGGLSGKFLKPVALRCIWELKKNFPFIFIIGGGGIMDIEDCLDFFYVGCDIISLGTLVIYNPQKAQEIAEYFQKNPPNHLARALPRKFRYQQFMIK